jgi:hypothetical protein
MQTESEIRSDHLKRDLCQSGKLNISLQIDLVLKGKEVRLDIKIGVLKLSPTELKFE